MKEKEYDAEYEDEMTAKSIIFIICLMAVLRLLGLVIGIIYDSIKAGEFVIDVPDFGTLVLQWAVMTLTLCAPVCLAHSQEKQKELLKK